MFNKRHDQQEVHINNYNTVYPSAQQNGATPAFAFGIVALVAIAAIYVIARLVLSTIWAIAGVLTTLIAGFVSVAPIVVGGAVVVVLLKILFTAMPEAIDEVQDIRYRRALAHRNRLMLETKTVDGFCVAVEEKDHARVFEHN